MYIPNFKFLAQFGGELCEEQTKNKINLPKNHIFWAMRGWDGTEKLRPSKKHIQGPNFKFPAQFGGMLCEGQTKKIRINCQKTSDSGL